jgi:hypothetical protein
MVPVEAPIQDGAQAVAARLEREALLGPNPLAGTAPEDYRKPDQFFAHLLHAGATRARRDGATAALGSDREHRASAHADHPIRWRQDAYPDRTLPPRDERRCVMGWIRSESCSRAAAAGGIVGLSSEAGYKVR